MSCSNLSSNLSPMKPMLPNQPACAGANSASVLVLIYIRALADHRISVAEPLINTPLQRVAQTPVTDKPFQRFLLCPTLLTAPTQNPKSKTTSTHENSQHPPGTAVSSPDCANKYFNLRQWLRQPTIQRRDSPPCPRPTRTKSRCGTHVYLLAVSPGEHPRHGPISHRCHTHHP